MTSAEASEIVEPIALDIQAGSDVEADLLEVLKKYWGYSSFRPLQKEAMLSAMPVSYTHLTLPTIYSV